MFFITHATLDLEHVEYVFHSIYKQSLGKKLFNKEFFETLWIYNTHDHELSNNDIVVLYNKYQLSRYFGEIKIFDYSRKTPKKLVADILNIRNYCSSYYHPNDRILILKSDTCISKNFFKEISELPKDKPVAFFAPYVCAKKRISKPDILEYCQRETFVESDDITFFTEDENGPENSDFYKRPDTSITDEKIKFFACRVIKVGFSSIFCDVELLNRIDLEDLDWGGTNFHNLMPYYIRSKDSFIVHMYHDIVSDNINRDREGPVSGWLNS